MAKLPALPTDQHGRSSPQAEGRPEPTNKKLREADEAWKKILDREGDVNPSGAAIRWVRGIGFI